MEGPQSMVQLSAEALSYFPCFLVSTWIRNYILQARSTELCCLFKKNQMLSALMHFFFFFFN